ncbi:hypothetical protein CMI39_03295 [Candidatus Pacearchaeota archaeon]|nr:hypothetical protein [Candidatus Pacearchaeota archaeon]|tara:strand:+ start:2454 stop:3005 length:552 start_codon:yes stop_codon:yes gene_type:complete
MAKKYTKTEEKPLSEVIGNRKNYYQTKIAEAFETVYKSKDFEYIGQFEKIVSKLTARALKGNLEGIIKESKRGRPRKIKEIDKRPRLTSYQYAKSRDEGMTNEEIKNKFRMDSPYHLSGFSRKYNKNLKERKKDDTRPKLTSKKYAKAKDDGMTNKEIKNKFRIDSARQLGGFAYQYLKKRKK